QALMEKLPDDLAERAEELNADEKLDDILGIMSRASDKAKSYTPRASRLYTTSQSSPKANQPSDNTTTAQTTPSNNQYRNRRNMYCTYCHKSGHTEKFCRLKPKSPSAPTAYSEEQQTLTPMTSSSTTSSDKSTNVRQAETVSTEEAQPP